MNEKSNLENESVRLAMDQAWRDHHHTRDQTWKVLQIEFLLIVGIIGADWLLDSLILTIVSAALVAIITVCGIQITLRHRNRVEVNKFNHIINCEGFLELDREYLIGKMDRPNKIKIRDALNPIKGNTSLFILRMHLAIMGFALFVLIYKLIGTIK